MKEEDWTGFIFVRLTDEMDRWIWHNVDPDAWDIRIRASTSLYFKNKEDAVAFKLCFNV